MKRCDVSLFPRKQWQLGIFLASIALALSLTFATMLTQPIVHANARTATRGPLAAANTLVSTYKNNSLRTGGYTTETTLTTSNVNTSQFGRRVSYPVDGAIYAQPLFVPGVTVKGNVYDVAFVETEHDGIYAFDANQTSATAPLWYTSFLNPPSVTSVSSSAVSCNDITPEYGITGTPVINVGTQTMYVVVNTNENGTIVYRLHAINIATGLDKPGSPVTISASVPGNGSGSSNGSISFDPVHQFQRGGLLLLNGTVYIDWGSHCDNDPYHGWLMGYNASTLQQKTVYASTPNGSRAGIWESGQGIAADGSGNIYLATGNGTFDLASNGSDSGDSILKFSTTNGLQLSDYFTPFNQSCLEGGDVDLGSGGTLLLPNINELVQVGKEGRIYVVNRGNLGKYTPDPNLQCGTSEENRTDLDKVTQELPPNTAGGGVWGSPTYWSGPTGQYVYIHGQADHVKAFKLTNGLLSTSATSQSPESSSFPGGDPIVSSNGATAGTGIVWYIDPSAVLRAYDATNLGTELYSSSQNASRDGLGSYTKFSVPVVGNGHVFVGTQNSLNIFGLLGSGANGSLAVGKAAPLNPVNLTLQGPTDWEHWGLTSATSLDHKNNVTPQISNYSEIGTATVQQYGNNPNGYRWSDGTPTAKVSSTPTGIAVSGTGNGFRISIPASTTAHTVKVYVGVSLAQGQFTASLSDNSATSYSDTSLNNANGISALVYTLTYHAASPGQTLTITFTMKTSYSASGTVTLQAAALN